MNNLRPVLLIEPVGKYSLKNWGRFGKGLGPILSNWHPLDCIQHWRTRTLRKEEKIKIQHSAYTPFVIRKEKDYGIIRDFRSGATQQCSAVQCSAVQCSAYKIKNTILFYTDNFERSNLDIIDSPCGLHVRKIKYAFALLSRRKWSLDDLKQETIHIWRQKEVIFILFPFPRFAKFLNHPNLEDYNPF